MQLRRLSRVLVLVSIAAGCGGGFGNAGDRGGAGGRGGAAGSTGAAGTTGAGGDAGTGGASGTSGTSGASGTSGRGGVVGTGGVSGQGGGTSCGSVERPTTAIGPDILILQDASNSMNDDITNTICSGGCGQNSKWTLMTAALNQVVSQTQTDVNWGLKLFADTGTCGVSSTPAAGVAAGNSTAIAASLSGRTDANGNVTNGSSTPTRAAENAAVAYMTSLTDTNPKYIVLATDGLPNCPVSGTQTTDDSTGAIQSVTAGRLAGIPTFVIGIATSGGMAELTLNMMAMEGGRPQAGQATMYYSVTSKLEFATALQAVVGLTSTCTFVVPPPPTNDGTTSRADIGVKGTTTTGSGVTIPQDATNGWTYTDATMKAILLHGTACDDWKAKATTGVSIVFHCRTI